MGAWIEIILIMFVFPAFEVAPHMGAWIEIIIDFNINLWNIVAPHMGAWIEIIHSATNFGTTGSHPTWVRGLKYSSTSRSTVYSLSHPTWVRGLKYVYSSVPNPF